MVSLKLAARSGCLVVGLLVVCLLVQNASCDLQDDDSDDAKVEVTEQDNPEGEEGVAKVIVPEEIEYSSPQLERNNLPHLFYEHFDSEDAIGRTWIKSQATKAESDEMKYDGEWTLTGSHSRVKGDGALLLQSRARHHAIAARLNRPFRFKDEQSLILQYEVQFRNGQECGGAYIKLLVAPSGDLSQMNDKTPYSIMFGPDKCGNDHKVHFILMHRNPKNGTLREVHWNKATSVSKLEEAVKDGKWHLLRLHIRSDNSFEVQFDKKSVGKGSLLEDFNPSVNPSKEIDDPDDRKPEDWDEREKIPDPDSLKPDEWDESEPRKITDPNSSKPNDWNEDESEMVPDPEANKPGDWDNEMDGEWEAPLIANPKCTAISGCGKWSAPLIDNPNYRGKWKPPLVSNANYKGKWSPGKIPNPEFFEDPNPYTRLQSIDALAFELWTVSDNIAFDNVLVTSNVDVANYVLDHTFQVKKDLADAESDSVIVRLMKYTNKKPWLWAVYVLVIALPVVLFIAFCCVQPVKKTEADTAARKKKTDEPTPDFTEYAQASQCDQTPTQTVREPSVPKQQPKEKTPIVEENEEVAEDGPEEPEEPEEEVEEIEEEVEENGGVEEEEDEATEEEEDDEVNEEPETRTSPRLRKLRTRKE